MKKLFATLVAATVLVAPMAASADQYRPRNEKHHADRFDRRDMHKQRWTKGKKLSRAERRHIVNSRDYRRYNLRPPHRGEQWVRIDNQFLLVSAATGLIIGLAAAR